MKNYKFKILNIFIILCFIIFGTPAFALSSTESEFNGADFFASPLPSVNDKNIDTPYIDRTTPSGWKDLTRKENTANTIPPLKLIRLKFRAFHYTRLEKKQQKEAIKKQPQEKEIVNEQDDESLESTEGTNKDSEIKETNNENSCENEDSKKIAKKRNAIAEDKENQQVIIDCENMNYATETGIIDARGHVVTTFPEQQTVLKADNMIYDKSTNHVKARGNVVIIRSGQETFGEALDVDLNKENFLIDKPITETPIIKINAEKGFVQKNIITQEKGTINVEGNYKIHLQSGGGSIFDPELMKLPEEERTYATEGKSKIFKMQAKTLIITSKENLDILDIRKGLITSTTGKTILKIPRMKMYTNKGRDYVEGNYPELGSRKNLGMFVGPGFVIELPRGSLLKVMPILTYKGKIGVGGFARFSNGTNRTEFGYGSSYSKFILRGEQKLDDNLSLIYGSYDYLDNWFLGRRAPKYGADLIYRKAYEKSGFLFKDETTKFEQRISAGYFQETNDDKYYNKLYSSNAIGTTRFRHMAQITQNIWHYDDDSRMLHTSLGVNLESSVALYGTGNLQAIGRVGPSWHIQYQHWMQDIGYYQSAYSDDTPIPVYDAYRYGRSNVYLREYWKIHKYLTLAWFGSVTLSNDSPTTRKFQECSFYASVGPDDLKLNIGYDFIRQNAFINFLIAFDPKGTTINYDKMVIKNPDNFNKQQAKNDAIYQAAHLSKPGDKTKGKGEKNILTKAVVEDIEVDRDADI